MATLLNKTRQIEIVKVLVKAQGFRQRLKGLIGKDSLSGHEGFWIPNCNSIHTFFMKFPIDAVFVDSNMNVCATYSEIKPWRLVSPVWSARSVIEFPSGTIIQKNITVGDQLCVVPESS